MAGATSLPPRGTLLSCITFVLLLSVAGARPAPPTTPTAHDHKGATQFANLTVPAPADKKQHAAVPPASAKPATPSTDIKKPDCLPEGGFVYQSPRIGGMGHGGVPQLPPSGGMGQGGGDPQFPPSGGMGQGGGDPQFPPSGGMGQGGGDPQLAPSGGMGQGGGDPQMPPVGEGTGEQPPTTGSPIGGGDGYRGPTRPRFVPGLDDTFIPNPGFEVPIPSSGGESP